ncbi:MAG: TfpX/TfpZ family type IV pilin accessory protein [Dokdonella sp.]
MSRWKAASIHLSISVMIGLLSAAMVFGVWYPPPYSHAAGADQLVLVLLGVDAVLGPLLTLIVYRHGKKGMRFDLAVIAIMQACAFSYGMSVVIAARPAFIVAVIDRFVIVTASDLAADDLAKGRELEFRTLSWSGPRLVYAQRPESRSERSDLLFSGVDGKDMEKFPKYYADYNEHAAAMLDRKLPLSKIHDTPEAHAILDAWLLRHSRDRADVVWVPLVARRADMVMLLDRKDGEVLGALPIDPW